MYQDPEDPQITRHFARPDGRQVHFRLAGSGPPLVLLHQSPTSSAEMATEIAAFADGFTVISPDTPGYGLSDPLPVERPELDDFATALVEFLDALNLEQVLIYGFHTGAMIGFEFARRHPERVAAAVINGLVACDADEQRDLLASYLEIPEVTATAATWPGCGRAFVTR